MTSKKYPRTTVHKAGDGVWKTEDGYTIRRTEYFGADMYLVYAPGGTKPRSSVWLMREAREIIYAHRASGGECPNPHTLAAYLAGR